MTVPFTYLIGWSKHSKFYYGVRYRHNCSPDELWVKYFTSSKTVKRLRIELGEPDIIQVRRTFANAKDAQEWEHRVLVRIQAVKRSDFINKHDMISKNVWKGEKLSETHKKNIGNAIRGRKQDPEWIKKRTTDVWTGRKHSTASLEKMSLSHKGISRAGWHHSEETKTKLKKWHAENKPSLGLKRSDEMKAALREQNIGANNPNYGKRWWNDGTISKLSTEKPGETWVPGRLTKPPRD